MTSRIVRGSMFENLGIEKVLKSYRMREKYRERECFVFLSFQDCHWGVPIIDFEY